ncbi:unnamed protein product [Closterium sp. NIES-54]
MAPTPTLNNGNSSNPTSDSDRNTCDLTDERRNKRRAEDGPPAPTAVDVLLGGLEVPTAGPLRQRQRRRMAVSSSDATTAPALTQVLTPDQVNALLSLLQQQPVSITAAETALPAASASLAR